MLPTMPHLLSGPFYQQERNFVLFLHHKDGLREALLGVQDVEKMKLRNFEKRCHCRLHW